MANYGTLVQRPSTAPPSDSMPENDESKTSSTSMNGFKIVWPFNVPSTEEAALSRISRNLKAFALYYLLFVFLVLLITLIPKRKVSLVFLVIMREITFLYVLLLRALPHSIVLHKIIDKRFVIFLLSSIAGVELILTRAAIHLLITLASTAPIILAHALFWKEDLVASEDETAAAAESLLP